MSINLLSLDEGIKAVKLARKAIEVFLKEGITINDQYGGKFAEKRGVFTTLNKNHMLRGCIGLPYPIKRLDEAIVDSAISAAVRDPRFPPVVLEEMDEIVVEVTILTPPEKVEVKPLERHKFVKVGRDGLIVKSGYYSGLLLPQVAVEHGFDAEEFLSQTCLKAGLMPDCWLDEETEVFTFQGQIFEEIKPRGEIVEKDIGSCGR